MVETKITCDKCGKDIEGCYYSEVQIVGKYRQTNNKPEDIFSDLLFGGAQIMKNDMKIEVCPECAAKIKEEILLDSK